MSFWSLLADVFGGAALINAVPHLVSGLMGRRFPSPFAKPPGRGLSSAIVNLVWGFANLALAYVLLRFVTKLDFSNDAEAAAFAFGMLLLGLLLAWRFGNLNEGRGPTWD